MPWLTKISIVLIGLCVLGGCIWNDDHEPEWVSLTSSHNNSYTVAFRTFHDGPVADQPFEVMAKSKKSDAINNLVLFAEQCKNVKIVQSADYLYIFYDYLALRTFRGDQIYGTAVSPFLCDQSHSFCRAKLAELREEGHSSDDVCSFTTSNG